MPLLESQIHRNFRLADQAVTPVSSLRRPRRRTYVKPTPAQLRQIQDDAVRRLREAGHPVREIALSLGVSRQAVYQRLARLRAEDAALRRAVEDSLA